MSRKVQQKVLGGILECYVWGGSEVEAGWKRSGSKLFEVEAVEIAATRHSGMMFVGWKQGGSEVEAGWKRGGSKVEARWKRGGSEVEASCLRWKRLKLHPRFASVSEWSAVRTFLFYNIKRKKYEAIWAPF
eukprot:11571965-Karenia_brevis.AAC.2